MSVLGTFLLQSVCSAKEGQQNIPAASDIWSDSESLLSGDFNILQNAFVFCCASVDCSERLARCFGQRLGLLIYIG